MRPFVSAQWLANCADEVVIADVRWYLDGRSGRDAFGRGHLPGAVFVDLDQWLAGPPSREWGRHPLPSPETFARGMSVSGITNDSVVVAYDDAGGVIAARLVWLLRSLGTPAAVLDDATSALEGPLETSPRTVRPVNFEPRPWPQEMLATIDDVGSDANIVIDARDAQRYRGEVEPVDPRAGHIPGAHNVACRENLDADGRLLRESVLASRFIKLGVDEVSSVISYCGSGVTACHNLLVMEQVGLGRHRLFPGSWSQYSASERPVATSTRS